VIAPATCENSLANQEARMWRSILAMMLLPALTAAQTPQPTPQHASQPNHITAPTFRGFTFYDALRRGREEEAAVELQVSGLVTTPKSPVAGITPIKLELQPTDGLTIAAIRYPKGYLRTISSPPHPVSVVAFPRIFFKIHADESARLGLHTLLGKLTFQVVPYDGSTPAPVQQLDVKIPITVVEHDAHIQKANWPVRHIPVGLIVVMIILAPLLIAILGPIYLICAAEGQPGCG
jgi:hypothetical protein